jgi:hypothetical protein
MEGGYIILKDNYFWMDIQGMDGKMLRGDHD